MFPFRQTFMGRFRKRNNIFITVKIVISRERDTPRQTRLVASALTTRLDHAMNTFSSPLSTMKRPLNILICSYLQSYLMFKATNAIFKRLKDAISRTTIRKEA